MGLVSNWGWTKHVQSPLSLLGKDAWLELRPLRAARLRVSGAVTRGSVGHCQLLTFDRRCQFLNLFPWQAFVFQTYYPREHGSWGKMDLAVQYTVLTPALRVRCGWSRRAPQWPSLQSPSTTRAGVPSLLPVHIAARTSTETPAAC